MSRLLESKATVIALSKSRDNLDDLVKIAPAGSVIETICVNVQDWNATRKAVESHLPIDHVINNAGVARLTPFLQATEEEFDSSFDINVKAIVNISQVVAKDMIKRKVGGSIVNMSSQAAHAALPNHAIYCATKAAVDALTRFKETKIESFMMK